MCQLLVVFCFLVFFLEHQTMSYKVIPVASTFHPPKILALQLGSSSWAGGDDACPPHAASAVQGRHLVWELRVGAQLLLDTVPATGDISFSLHSPLHTANYRFCLQIEQTNFERVLVWKIFQQCPGDRTSQEEDDVCLHLVYRLSGSIFSYLHSSRGSQVRHPARTKHPTSCETVLKPLDQHHKMNVLQP